MAGEDLLEDDNTGTKGEKGKKKPLSKGQKIGVAIGAVTILLVIVQIERSKASAASQSATTTTAPIDPNTGYPSGSAQDQAALAAMQGNAASGGGGYLGAGSYSGGVDTSGTDPATGASYSSEISAEQTALSTLGTDFTTLEQQWSAFSINPGGPAIGTPTPTPTPTPGRSPLQSANLANLEAELKRDTAGKQTANKRAASTRLRRQITAVKARS